MVCMCQLGRCQNFVLWPRQFHLQLARMTHSSQLFNQQSPVKILYFGSDLFSLGPLRTLVKRMRKCKEGKLNINHIDVVASESLNAVKTKKKKNPHEFINYVRNNDLELHRWDKEAISQLANSYDFGVVASFGHLIPKKIIGSFNRGIINAHPSLLPRWRGAAPILHTILNGDEETGVTIIDLSVGRFDRGSVFLQKKMNIARDLTTEDLTSKLGIVAGEMVLDVIDNFDYFKQHRFAQTDVNASNAPKISAEISFIDWNFHTCDYLDRLHRAIGGKIGVHAYWKEKLVRLIEFEMADAELLKQLDSEYETSCEFGKVFFKKKPNILYVKCIDGWISVSKLQVEYKKPITATDFYNAYMVDRKMKGIQHDKFS